MIFLVCLLVFSLILISGGLYTAMLGEVLEEQIGKRALQVSRTVARMPLVKQQIIKQAPEGTLQQLAEQIRQEVGAEFIVIGNRDGIRGAQPLFHKIAAVQFHQHRKTVSHLFANRRQYH